MTELPDLVSNQNATRPPAIDTHTLLDNCMGNIALVTMLLEKFEKQAHDDLVSLAQSLKNRDAGLTARTSHALKGAAGALSAAGVQNAAAHIELAARQDQLDVAAECLEELKAEVDRCLACLPATLARLSDQGAGK